MAASSKIRPSRDHGNANREALAVARAALCASGWVFGAHAGVTVTFAVIGPTGNRPAARAVIRIESPGRIVGSFGGRTVTLPNSEVRVMACVPVSLTLPVFWTL